MNRMAFDVTVVDPGPAQDDVIVKPISQVFEVVELILSSDVRVSERHRLDVVKEAIIEAVALVKRKHSPAARVIELVFSDDKALNSLLAQVLIPEGATVLRAAECKGKLMAGWEKPLAL